MESFFRTLVGGWEKRKERANEMLDFWGLWKLYCVCYTVVKLNVICVVIKRVDEVIFIWCYLDRF